MSETERVDCPICGPGDQTPMFVVQGWNVTRCTKCRLAMINPRRKGLIEIYQDDGYFHDDRYYYDYEGNKAAYQKGFRSKLELIRKYCPGGGKLLDVGAAHGFFMEEAGRAGFEPFGVEMSKAAATRASRYGVVFNSPLAEVKTDHRFAVVTFIDSLEHFDQPADGLRQARDLLDDGGIVAVMVPNIDSLFARLTRTHWHLLLPDEHLFYFTPGSLRLLFEKLGLELLHVGTGGYGRSLAEVMRVVFGRKPVPILSAAESALRKVTFEINLGDLFAIARKPRAGGR